MEEDLMETEEAICSILAASLCAYGIDTDDGVEGFPLASDVGFTGKPPTTFTAGTNEIDACYVADTANSVILAFRGTAMPSAEEPLHNWEQVLRDWCNNFLLTPEEVKVSGIPGTLHEGFSKSVEGLWQTGFQTVVKKRMTGEKPVVITGYSKGRALAPIAAARLREELKVSADRMVIRMFEPPRPGDVTFAAYFNSIFPTALRYAYQNDIGPYLPPSKPVSDLLSKLPILGPHLENQDVSEWRYSPVGNLKFVNWHNKVVDDSSQVKQERLVHLALLISERKFASLVIDHFPRGHIYNVLCAKEYPADKAGHAILDTVAH